jgi:serine/threonine protein kinase
MPDTTKAAADPATVALYEVAQRIDALTDAWKGDDLPPNLAEFVPEGPAGLRRLVLSELIKVDLEYRWRHHELPKQVEEYIEEFPEVAQNGQVPCDLIYEEFHIRSQTPEAPNPDEYYHRFPKQADRLKRMMTIDANRFGSTTLVAGHRQANFEVGQQIDDFDLLVQLGKGSFGSVFLARQRSMQRLVALKISRDRGVEPQTLAQLDHPNIVRVYDQRVVPESKVQLMYMQHIPGGTLHDVLEGVRQLPAPLRTGKILVDSIDRALDRHGESAPADSPSRRRLAAMRWPEVVCWIGSRLAAALEYAHSRGVLHRDVKPANVLLAADGSPKLVDFNVSFSSKLEGATPAAYFGGSLSYMSPEQIEAYNPDHSRQPDEMDGRSDVYSLGIVLWELLTGSRPFSDEHLEDCLYDTPKLLAQLTARRRAGLTPAAVATLPPDLPPGLQQVLISCLASDVADRPASAGQLARQLELCLQPHVQRLLRPRPGSWRERFRRWPFWFFVTIGLAPSVIFSFLNLQFNQDNLTHHDKEAQLNFFKLEVLVVNGVLFPIAISFVLWFAWPVLLAVGKAGSGKPIESTTTPKLRRRALRVGDFAAWLGMSLWLLSGIAFPAGQLFKFGAVAVDPTDFATFLASQVVTGWISSTLTFFLLTFIFVRAFYPVLVRPDETHIEEVDGLVKLAHRCGWCFGLTIFATFLALGLVALGTATSLWWKIGLPVIGGACSLAAYWMSQLIRADLATLAVAIDPQREASSITTDTVSSLWTGTR